MPWWLDINQIFVYPPTWIPNPWQFDNYPEVFDTVPFLTYFRNTLTILGGRALPQQPDGLSRISGWVTPQCRATMEPALHKLGAPGMCNPDDA